VKGYESVPKRCAKRENAKRHDKETLCFFGVVSVTRDACILTLFVHNDSLKSLHNLVQNE
jgi:hypothetical protein